MGQRHGLHLQAKRAGCNVTNRKNGFTGRRVERLIIPSARPHMPLKLLSVPGILLAAATLSAQTPAAIPAPASCTENLRALASKTYEDYAGFRLEVKGEKKQRYDRMLSDLERRAAATSSSGCLAVLRDYIAWFEDPHLFLYQNSTIDSAEIARRAQSVRVINTSETKARSYFITGKRSLDPIEGIWYDRDLRVAIMKDPASPKSFVAAVLRSDTAGWPVGSVRATFTKDSRGRYLAEIALPNHDVQTRDAAIYKRTILRIAPTMWAKEFPVEKGDSGYMATGNPREPTLVARGRTVIVSIPSHDPSYKGILDSLVTAHRSDLMSAERIIIDVRGNEGGGSQMTSSLHPYIATRDKRASPFSTDFGSSVMLSSPSQIRYARRAFGSDTSAFVKSLVQRMEAQPGQFVQIRDPALPPEAEEPDSVIEGNWKVGVLVDGGTVSAAEVLVLTALRSKRATVFGEPTEGALDYQSTSIVWFSPNERRWALGYPTITAHAKLPAGGMRGKGIAPDVRLDLSKLADPISTVERLLSKE